MGTENDKKRIVGEKIDIDYSRVREFFETRGAGSNYGSKYNYVLFQDSNPELAEARDMQEKSKISGLLHLDSIAAVSKNTCGGGGTAF